MGGSAYQGAGPIELLPGVDGIEGCAEGGEEGDKNPARRPRRDSQSLSAQGLGIHTGYRGET